MKALGAVPVGIIGYGNQGRAHALNIRDSGFQVIVGQRIGKSAAQARGDGFEPRAVADAVRECKLLIITLPDESASLIYQEDIAPHLQMGHTLGFVHGFNIRYGFIEPPPEIDVLMIAPKGPGTLLRSLYVEGKGLPALMAIHRDASGRASSVALAWAAAIGSLRAAVVETTFATETETDLFGEQAVLCGGVVALCKAAFETLVRAGYEPEFAYLECVHELKQVVDLLYSRGLSGMYEAVSNTAEYGALTRGPQLVNEQTRESMRRVLEDVRSGAFAKEWIAQHRAGSGKFRQLHEAGTTSGDFERAGEAVRALMPWLESGGK